MWFKSKEIGKECYNSGGQHKFSGRYDKYFPAHGFKIWACIDDINALKEIIYICDVCEWCGKKIDRRK